MMAGNSQRFAVLGSAGTPTQLDVPLSLAGTGSVTSASVTPAVGGYVYAIVASRNTGVGSPPGAFTVSDTASGVWTSLGRTDIGPDGGNVNIALQAFRKQADGVAQTITVGCGLSGHMGVYLLRVGSSAADSSNQATGVDLVNGDPSVTLGSAPSSTSVTLGVVAIRGNVVIAAPAGWTELANWLGGTSLRMEAIYRAGTSGDTAAWTTLGQLALGWLLEVKAG